ncbi:hypothetical protein T439DRAFT_377365 [Meredithblackwellia eburnea MCA 4105]
MKLPLLIAATAALRLTTAPLAAAHGDDDHGDQEGTYAEIHMAQEHHLDNFDIQAFFHLHDLNRDGILDVNELESIYGVHHEKRRKESGSEEVHTAKAREIVQAVLAKLDKNGDGVLTMREFVAGGVGGLPNFQGVEHLGHHYDAEGEYFLHHEEKYHNTPETQNEEDYIHPEDIEHFMSHEKIEAEEEERVREFIEEPAPAEPAPVHAEPDLAEGEQRVFKDPFASTPVEGSPEPVATPASPSPKVEDANGKPPPSSSEELARQERAAFARAQAAKFSKDSREAAARGEWGSDGSMKRPKDAADRLRKAIPYKYRTKKSFWGEF